MTHSSEPARPDADTFSQVLRLLHAAEPVTPAGTGTPRQQALRTACLAAAAYGTLADEAMRAELNLLAIEADLDEVTASRASVLPAMAGDIPEDLPAIWYWQASLMAGQLLQARHSTPHSDPGLDAISDTARALMLLLQAHLSPPVQAADTLAEANEMLACARTRISNSGRRT
ncbi:hypothetical protein [Streptomyces sp. WM6378]|uniref:hypothetical protein n=1 Tax=Streptomyces sp. WM6378 TaxID=1415557 RepID=UPI0006AED163|nr:hypothetical protein [Streptomyces sp. WM6378]KOU36431.1 hypothetical protein ADK54_33500 [Streptomyces sp. WM6378]